MVAYADFHSIPSRACEDILKPVLESQCIVFLLLAAISRMLSHRTHEHAVHGHKLAHSIQVI